MSAIKITKIGNSQGFTLPKDLLKKANFKLGDVLEVSLYNGKLIIFKAKPHHSKMKFEDRITADMKTALKSGQKKRLETLRYLRAMILEFQKSGKNEELTEEKAIELLNKAAKKRKNAIAR